MNSEPRLLHPFITAAYLVRAFYRLGIRHAILSPGSRSTPLTMAFAYHPGFSKQVILDERPAAFTALGIGKESGKPAILVCTSGTAATNYHPAVAEARESGVPMIVCTADRPPALRGIGSSQTLDQIKLYGNHAVWFHELGEPANKPNDIRRIEFAGQQALHESIQSGGASHLNIPFRKPLEPSRSQIEEQTLLFEDQLSEKSAPVSPESSQTITLSNELTGLFNRSKRPLLIAGPADPFRQQYQTVRALSEKINAPVLAEPGSGILTNNFRINRFEQILRNSEYIGSLKPDMILRFGDQPFTKSMLQAMHAWNNVPLIRFDGRDSWQDHEMSADFTVHLKAEDQLNIDSIKPKTDSSYLNEWTTAETDAESQLKASMSEPAELCDGHIFHHLSNHLPETWNTIFSNSLPVRDAALFGYPAGNIYLNRGAAGIDGIISTATGTARSSGAPTCCVIGDLAFLHDSNALLSLKKLDSPFAIVVINNNGGNIFRMLPIHEHSEIYNSYFETPQDTGIRQLTLAHHLNYRRIDTVGKLQTLRFDDTAAFEKPVVIECVTNPDESMKLRSELWGIR